MVTVPPITNSKFGPIRHRMRWTFEGLNASGQTVFPKTFVRLKSRPALPYIAIADENGGRIESFPSTIIVSIDNAEMFSVELSKEPIKTAHLRLWKWFDNSNSILEEWKFTDVKLSCWEEDIINECFGLTISYNECEFVRLTPNILPNLERIVS